MQEEGGTSATVAAGVAALAAMLPWPRRRGAAGAGEASGGRAAMRRLRRVLGHLRQSGARRAADLLVAEGGTAILSETPEIYGAEICCWTGAAIRGRRPAERICSTGGWTERAARDGGTLDNNPSPGNKARRHHHHPGKIARRRRQGGIQPARGVCEYAEPVDAPGLVFMDSPGFDPVSATGQVAGGANLICFTTGRGSCFGCAPAPSLKIATNTALFRRMAGDMDLDAGTILDGIETHAEVGERIFRSWLATASGRPHRQRGAGIRRGGVRALDARPRLLTAIAS